MTWCKCCKSSGVVGQVPMEPSEIDCPSYFYNFHFFMRIPCYFLPHISECFFKVWRIIKVPVCPIQSVVGVDVNASDLPAPFNVTIDNRIWIGFQKTNNLTSYCRVRVLVELRNSPSMQPYHRERCERERVRAWQAAEEGICHPTCVLFHSAHNSTLYHRTHFPVVVWMMFITIHGVTMTCDVFRRLSGVCLQWNTVVVIKWHARTSKWNREPMSPIRDDVMRMSRITWRT